VEQYQKFSSDKIGSPNVDLQSTIASPPPFPRQCMYGLTPHQIFFRLCPSVYYPLVSPSLALPYAKSIFRSDLTRQL